MDEMNFNNCDVHSGQRVLEQDEICVLVDKSVRHLRDVDPERCDRCAVKLDEKTKYGYECQMCKLIVEYDLEDVMENEWQ